MSNTKPLNATVTTAYELNGELNLVLQVEESGEAGILTFKTTSWNDESKELQDDEVVKAETNEKLEEIFGLDFDAIKENPLSIVGQEVEAYWDEAYQKFRLTQPVSFTKYERITVENVKQIKDFAKSINESNPIITLPLEEHYGVRLKLGISIPEIGNFRLSQLTDEIETGKLNYATSKINTLKKSLDESTDLETKATLEKIYDANVKTAKANCLINLKANFGIDFEDLLSYNGKVALSGLEVKDFSLNGKTAYYLVGVLSEDQELEENEELKAAAEEAELED